jgi:hypothetical protein
MSTTARLTLGVLGLVTVVGLLIWRVWILRVLVIGVALGALAAALH